MNTKELLKMKSCYGNMQRLLKTYRPDSENAAQQQAEWEHLVAQFNRYVAFFNGITDPVMRRIFEYRYADGMPWSDIAVLLGEASGNAVRKKHMAYLGR